jgi:TolB-like protein
MRELEEGINVADEGADQQPTGAGPAPRDVFISYASQDAGVANAVAEALERSGIACWIAPRDVTPGTFYGDEIVHAIDAANASVLILSQNAAASQHVLREVERAASKRHPVVSLRIDQAPLPAGLEYFLNTSQWLDASGVDIARSMPKLIAAVRIAMKAPVVTQAPSTPQIAVTPSPSSGSQKRRAIVVASLIGLVIIGFAGNRMWVWSRRVEPAQVPTVAAPAPATPAIPEKSVAVLPFVDMSEKKNREYFSDGMSEEILDLLAKMPNLKVIGRTSSFQFKGKTEDLRSIGSKLGAAYVVEGSVRQSSNQVRVTAQLISTQDGAHLWSETYDKPLGDVLQMQGQIAAGIARALQVTMTDSDVMPRDKLHSAEAYNIYLQGRHAVDRYDQSGFEEGVADFQQALELDPTFARAAVWLAWTYLVQSEFGFLPPSGMERARDATVLALRLDPNSAMAHANLAEVYLEYDWDWAAGEDEVKRALALESRNVWGLLVASSGAAVLGHWDEAFRYSNEAIAVSPLEQAAWYWLALTRLRAGRLDEAEAACHKTLEISPTYTSAHYLLGEVLLLKGHPDMALSEMKLESEAGGREEGLAIVYHALGRRVDAKGALAKLTTEDAADSPYTLAEVHAFRGEIDDAIEWLERAYKHKDIELWQIKGDPLLKGLERDSRYKVFLHRMKLPD